MPYRFQPLPRAARRALRALFAGALLGALPSAPARAQATAGLTADPAGADDALAVARFDEARALYDAGLFGPAARALARFRDAYPRDARAPEALFLHAESALATGDAETAAALYARFEADYPGSPLAPRARAAQGRYFYATGDDARAEVALTDALANPGSNLVETAQTAYLLGMTQRRQNRPDAAAAAFQLAAEADTPTAPAALYALGTVRTGQGDAAGIADAFEELGTRYPASPENAQVRLALAEAYLRTDRFADAAAEAARRRPALTGDDAERADLTLGETRLRLGETEAALAPLRAVPSEGRYGRRAALAIGRALYARGDAQGATTALAGIRTTPTDPTVPGAPTTGAADDPLALEAAYYEGLALKASGNLGDAEARLAFVARYPTSAYGDAALLELGLLRYESRRTDDAVDAFRRLLAITPPSPYAGEAARLLGETYAAAGRTAEAQEAFRRAESLGTATAETRAEVAFQDAFARYTARDYDAATDALLGVARDFPRSERTGEALFWAGEGAFQAGRYDRAETILTDFTTRFPQHRQADAGRYVLAWTFFRRRDYARAATGYERFLAGYTASSDAVPYVADALLRLGDSYFALGRFDDARAAYARVPAASTDGAGSDYALFQTAQAFASQGQTATAIETYGRLVDTFPTSTLRGEALLSRAALRAATSDADGAVADYQRVVGELPTSDAAPRALVGVGDVRLEQRRYPDAEAAYRSALDRYPASPSVADALDGLSAALDAQGRTAEVEPLADAIEARTADPEAKARIRLRRAQAALELGDAALATSRLQTLLAGNPPPDIAAEARLALGGAQLAQNQAPAAVATFRALIQADPQGPLAPEAQLQLADALLAAGDAQGALDAAAAYPRLYPGDPERTADALRREADALRALSRTADADARLRDLLTRFPTSAAADDVRRERPDLAPTAPAPTRQP